MTRHPTIDVRQVAPAQRHALIFSTFAGLQAGEVLELVNDHDPKPLHAQLQDIAGGTFTWTYLQQGPGTWHVAIEKKPAQARSGSCCGACGGA